MTPKRSDLEAEADQLLREAGFFNLEHGILPHPDNRGARHEWRTSEDMLDIYSQEKPDRRSTRQKATITVDDSELYGRKRKIRTTDPSQDNR